MNSEQKIVGLHLIYEIEKIMYFQNVCTFVTLRLRVFDLKVSNTKLLTINHMLQVGSLQGG